MEDDQFSKVSYGDVGSEYEGQRLDNFLIRHLKGVPKSRIYNLLRKGEVRINKGRVKPDTRLKVNDVIRIAPIRMRRFFVTPMPIRGHRLDFYLIAPSRNKRLRLP